MPRFFFDTRIGDKVHRDDEGDVFADAEAAVQRAKLDAAEYVADIIAHAGTPHHEEKLVRNEAGEIVDRFMILDALSVAIPRLH